MSVPNTSPNGFPDALNSSVASGPSTTDLIGLYTAGFIFVFGIGSIFFYIVLSYFLYRQAARLRTPPSSLKTDILTAAEQISSVSETLSKVKLPDYKSRTAAVRRALVLKSKNPAHYTNFYVTSQAETDGFGSERHGGLSSVLLKGLDPAERELILAPQDAIDALKGNFDPLKITYDDTKPSPNTDQQRKITFGFFHPYANAGGGGERVLWAAVKATLEQSPRNICVIYTGVSPPQSQPLDQNDGKKSSQDPSSNEINKEFKNLQSIKQKVTDEAEQLKYPESPASILRTVRVRFGLQIDTSRVVFIYIPNRHLVDPHTWPRFTLVLQALGSIALAYEAISRFVPDVFVDTMGYPFIYPLVSWITNAPIAAYVHYPVISSDMISAMVNNTDNLGSGSSTDQLIKQQKEEQEKKDGSDSSTFQKKPRRKSVSQRTVDESIIEDLKGKNKNGNKNTGKEIGRVLFRTAKYLYWQSFALCYTFVGSYVSVVMANSSWTVAHMRKQWSWGHSQTLKKSNSVPSKPLTEKNGNSSKGNDVEDEVQTSRIKVVYPPCATQDLETANISEPRGRDIVYVAQFRPEKRHELVITEFANFLERLKTEQEEIKAKSVKPEHSQDIKQLHTAKQQKRETRIAKLQPPRLVLVGTIRNDDDRSAVYSLRVLAHELKLVEFTDFLFMLDAPWSGVTSALSSATLGINAMWNEHFGMVVVEYMAAGLVPIVHNSGGPKLDIVVPFAETTTSSSTSTSTIIQDDNKNTDTSQRDEKQQLLPTGFKFRAPQDPIQNYDDGSAISISSNNNNNNTRNNNNDDNENSIDVTTLNNPSTQSLADCLYTAYTLPPEILRGYRARARASAHRFSDAAFAHAWQLRVETLVLLDRKRRHERITQGLYY